MVIWQNVEPLDSNLNLKIDAIRQNLNGHMTDLNFVTIRSHANQSDEQN